MSLAIPAAGERVLNSGQVAHPVPSAAGPQMHGCAAGSVLDESALQSVHPQAAALLRNALSEAYKAAAVPTGVMDWMLAPRKPGKVCAIFFNGRSGSVFAQYFFVHYCHPNVLTAHTTILNFLDTEVPQQDLDLFNTGALGQGAALRRWCEALVKRLEALLKPAHLEDEPSDHLVRRGLFTDLVLGQLMALRPGQLDWDNLLKLLMLAYRCALGNPLDCSRPPVYLWQAHSPSVERRGWLRDHFPDSLQLTVVRYPEKSLDSHLVHHTFEHVFAPLHKLFRRLLLAWMATNSALLDGPDDGRERALRFEDLHEHTEAALRGWCAWMGVDFHPGLLGNHYYQPVRGQTVAGVRKLTAAEFEPRLLNHYDRLRMRALMREEYRAWGYAERARLDESLAELDANPLARSAPFGVQALLGQLDADAGARPNEHGTAVLLAEQARLLQQFAEVRVKRAAGWRPIPLLPLVETP